MKAHSRRSLLALCEDTQSPVVLPLSKPWLAFVTCFFSDWWNSIQASCLYRQNTSVYFACSIFLNNVFQNSCIPVITFISTTSSVKLLLIKTNFNHLRYLSQNGLVNSSFKIKFRPRSQVLSSLTSRTALSQEHKG